MQTGVDDDPRRAEDRGLVLIEKVLRVGEEALLAHDALRVERPALAEVRGSDDPARVRRVRLRHHEVPVVTGVGLVHRGRWDAGAAVALQALLHLLWGRAIRRIGEEEVPGQRVAERRRALI